MRLVSIRDLWGLWDLWDLKFVRPVRLVRNVRLVIFVRNVKLVRNVRNVRLVRFVTFEICETCEIVSSVKSILVQLAPAALKMIRYLFERVLAESLDERRFSNLGVTDHDHGADGLARHLQTLGGAHSNNANEPWTEWRTIQMKLDALLERWPKILQPRLLSPRSSSSSLLQVDFLLTDRR